MAGEQGDSFFTCNEVAGDNGCKEKINKGGCPSCKEGISDSCKGDYRSPTASLQTALQWIHESKTTQTQTAGFV